MPGLFGVVDLQRGRGGRDLHALACEVARRLTRQPNYRCDLHRTQWAVFGRIGASFHDNTPWPAESGQPAVAGILHDPPAAMAAVRLRSLEQAGAASLLRPDLRSGLHEAWSKKIAEFVGELGGVTPGQAKDILYFDHRLQGYLNTGAMLRQVYLDHRNPLLDETLFDFMELVPDALRHHKLLFQQAMAHRYPKLWRIGIAGAVNTEDWRAIYARDPQIRRFLEEEFADAGSGVWEYLDRSQAHRLIEAVTSQQAAPGALRPRVKSALRSALEFAPPSMMKLVSRPPRRPPTGAARLIMRVVALKYWFDALQRA